jgi:uncharacterized protein YjiS (DUF1127 family)
MNGFSDARLTLYSQELCEAQTVVAHRSCPPDLNRWALYRHRWTSRRVLLALSEDQMRDVGLTAGQALREGLKPFWRE